MTALKWLAAPTPCRECGLLTETIKIGGRLPMHVSCDPRAALLPADPLAMANAMYLFGTRLDADMRRKFSPADPEMTPEEIGPCVRCRRPTRRYGPYARLLCSYCDR